MVSYQELLPAASLMMIASCSVILGICFSNWPYDYYTLWNTSYGEEGFTKALIHYQVLANQPDIINYSMIAIMSVAFIGSFIKIFKPSEDTKYFEYGSLVALVAAVCIYITNIRTGELSAVAGQWGDVDQNTGLSVIAASEVMIVFFLLGVVVLQSGLFYAEYSDYKAKANFYLNELNSKLDDPKPAKSETAKPAAQKASGASTSKTHAKSRKTQTRLN